LPDFAKVCKINLVQFNPILQLQNFAELIYLAIILSKQYIAKVKIWPHFTNVCQCAGRGFQNLVRFTNIPQIGKIFANFVNLQVLKKFGNMAWLAFANFAGFRKTVQYFANAAKLFDHIFRYFAKFRIQLCPSTIAQLSQILLDFAEYLSGNSRLSPDSIKNLGWVFTALTVRVAFTALIGRTPTVRILRLVNGSKR
jgi:hypothetical protein